ncbi:AAA family ATPase [Streptomyces glaucosporus]|uniref:AAA family ATPase n=1 Tax=Streptomyces glaucosporus TaxID=284044 RepID=A0ABP5VI50_9ACTN
MPRGVPASARAGGRDLRGTAGVRVLRFPAGDRVVVSGLPGSGKSTLIRRVVAAGERVRRIDSQDMRERWERRLPARLPYAVYRPLVRAAHYLSLWRALASDAGVVVHDCGTQSWVRRWLARDARRRGRALHMVLLDVPPEVALSGQAARGRGVSAYAFARHRRAVGRLVAEVESGRPPAGCVSAVLLDRPAAGALRGIVFEGVRDENDENDGGGDDGGGGDGTGRRSADSVPV